MARELHPDVSDLDPTEALSKFRVVKEAYDKLMNNKNAGTQGLICGKSGHLQYGVAEI